MTLYLELKSFFQENQSQLIDTYPGITFERLWQEWELGPHFGHRDPFELKESCSLSGMSSFCHQLLEGIPLAYISGKTFFYNMWFRVGPEVLIPRFETEILVEMALKWSSSRSRLPLRIIDVGTGSGAILLSFLNEFKGPVEAFGSDLSQKALKWAQTNERLSAFRRDPTLSIKWFLQDRLEGVEEKFDLILSNPPYIPLSMRSEVHHQVDQFEPSLALYIEDNDYLLWYHRFFTEALHCLNPNGAFFMEGEESWLWRLKQLALDCGFITADVEKDLQQRWRFLKCTT